MNANKLFLILILVVTAAMPGIALGSSSTGGSGPAVTDSIDVRCPASINVGAKTLPEGWSDAFAIRNELFSGSAVNAGAAIMVCEYGNITLHKNFPKGYQCAVKAKPRDFTCSPAKPSPIKIPGKKGTN